MKRLVALIMGVAFVSAVAGVAWAQAPSTTPPKEEKKTEKPAETKRPVAQNASGTVKTAAADNLVVAMGSYQLPRLPVFAGSLDPDIRHLIFG